jgi:thioester reductase-like protein
MAALISPTSYPSAPSLDLRAEVILAREIRASEPARYCARPQHILLTGASGFLGAFLLASLLQRTQATVHCLIRCAHVADGQRRLDANMRMLDLPEYERDRVVVVPGDLAQPLLGLNEHSFRELAGQLDVIYHNGASVDRLHTYATLKAPNVLGTQEILRLAATGAPKHVHYVSTLSTIPPIESAGPAITSETELAEFWPGLSMGYNQSKWVAERLVGTGGERGIPFTIYRPTHIGGSSISGASNADDVWSLFVDACLMFERVPDVELEINSLPVD